MFSSWSALSRWLVVGHQSSTNRDCFATQNWFVRLHVLHKQIPSLGQFPGNASIFLWNVAVLNAGLTGPSPHLVIKFCNLLFRLLTWCGRLRKLNSKDLNKYFIMTEKCEWSVRNEAPCLLTSLQTSQHQAVDCTVNFKPAVFPGDSALTFLVSVKGETHHRAKLT